MKRMFSLVLALALCASLALPALAAEGETPAPETGQPAVSFADIPEGHSFYSAIMDCAAKGITSGYSDGTFRPTNSVTRAQFCVMLARTFYPDDLKREDTAENKARGWFVPAARALYFCAPYGGALSETSFQEDYLSAAAMDRPISRYDMAQLMTNIMAAKGFSAAAEQKSEAQGKIADYKSIPAQYQDAVKNVFALGIITGYSDGTFSGNNAMNRGQGCVVIYRMAQYTPAASNPVTPEADVPPAAKPATPVQPEQPETPAAKTLTNGKPVTEDNVMELLDELKAKYPEGTSFVNGYRPNGISADVNPVISKYPTNKGNLLSSTTHGCGGWGALVSDYIFGESGFPARQVSLDQVRPGDIVLCLNPDGKLRHVAIAISHVYRPEGAERVMVDTTDANRQGDLRIYWSLGESQWDDGYGGSLAIWTRYPD